MFKAKSQTFRLGLVLLLSGCSLAPAESPASTATVEPSGPAPTLTAAAQPTPAPSPDASPAPTPDASSTPTVTPPSTAQPQPPAGWTLDPSFPRANATVTIAFPRVSFGAGGWVDASTAACPERRRAVIWHRHPDGWFEVEVDRHDDASIVSYVNDARYGFGPLAIGTDGSYDCPGNGVAVWSATDKSDWYRVDDVDGFPHNGEVADAVGVEGEIVISGWDPQDDSRMGIWLSVGSQGMHGLEGWRSASVRPPTELGSALVYLAAVGSVVVGFDRESATPVWYSIDGGDTWQNSRFRPEFEFRPTAAIAHEGRIVVVGGACCAAARQEVGAAFWSSDGVTWQPANPGVLPHVPEALAVSPLGLIALGQETYVSETGEDWTLGRPLPGYAADEALVAAANATEILVIGEGRSWFAPSQDVVGEEPVGSVAPQEIGTSFRYELLTHCGPDAATIQFDLHAWVPDPETLVDGEFPSSYEDPAEPGTITYVEAGVLEFTGRQGDVVRYLPAAEQPGFSFCA